MGAQAKNPDGRGGGIARKPSTRRHGAPMQGHPRLTASVLSGDLEVEISRDSVPVQHVRCADASSAIGLAAVINGSLP